LNDQQARAARAVARAHDEEWTSVLAATARLTRDLDLAEDCVQDAYAQALFHWSASGTPRRPGAWLTTVAKRRALEAQRRAATFARKVPIAKRAKRRMRPHFPTTGSGWSLPAVIRPCPPMLSWR
jgi:RNA polymerase sigma-70 factor (ECF subfamily)